MKIFLTIIIVCFSLCRISLTSAQQNTPIEISPYIGNKLDRVERDYFKLFSKIKGFQEAVFYLNPDSTLKVDIVYDKDGSLRDTVLSRYRNLWQIQNHIEQTIQFNLYYDELTNRGEFASCTLTDSSKISGELLAVEENSVLVYRMTKKSYEAKRKTPFNLYKLYQNDIENVCFKEKSKNLSIIYFFVGGIAGGIVGYSVANNYNLTTQEPQGFKAPARIVLYSLVGMILGMMATIPLVIFLPIETSSETIFKTPFNEADIEGLRDRSRYEDEVPYYLQIIK